MSLENMPFVKRMEFMERIAAVIVDVLSEYGPLSQEAVTFFVQRAWRKGDHDGWLSANDLRVTLLAATSSSNSGKDKLDDIAYSHNTFLYSLKDAPEAEPILPSPRDWVEAFYTLYERYDAVRRNPQLNNLPEGLLDEMFGKLD